MTVYRVPPEHRAEYAQAARDRLPGGPNYDPEALVDGPGCRQADLVAHLNAFEAEEAAQRDAEPEAGS